MNASLLADLGAIVGTRWVRHRRAELATYTMDGLPTHESYPGVVVLPASRAELVRVIQLLHAHGDALRRARRRHRALGRRASPTARPVLVALTRLNRILARRPGARGGRWWSPAWSMPGSSEAVAPHGLQYVPDPSSQTACTIGGNVAENAGGPHCLKAGVTTNHVVELEVVLPDGSIIAPRLAARRAVGP